MLVYTNSEAGKDESKLPCKPAARPSLPGKAVAMATLKCVARQPTPPTPVIADMTDGVVSSPCARRYTLGRIKPKTCYPRIRMSKRS